jgi:hypothetical protein
VSLLALGGTDSKGLLGFGEVYDFPKLLITDGLYRWLGFGVKIFCALWLPKELGVPDLG